MTFTFTSFNAVGPDQNGNGGSIFTFAVPKSKVTMQWFTTDSGTSTHIDLQLSLDGVNFFDVVQGVGPSGVITSDGQIAVAARARLQNLTPGGPNPTITAIIGVEPTVTGLSITQS